MIDENTTNPDVQAVGQGQGQGAQLTPETANETKNDEDELFQMTITEVKEEKTDEIDVEIQKP